MNGNTTVNVLEMMTQFHQEMRVNGDEESDDHERSESFESAVLLNDNGSSVSVGDEEEGLKPPSKPTVVNIAITGRNS